MSIRTRNGLLLTIDEFVEGCKNNQYNDDVGFGVYFETVNKGDYLGFLTSTRNFSFKRYIDNGFVDTDWDGILWFNHEWQND